MDDKKKPRLTKKLKKGGQVKHGGYSFMTKGTLPENRKHILRYLTAARENLVKDLGPTENDLTTAQIILIDRVVSKLGIARCIEAYIAENTVMVGDDLAPALKASYLSYNNSILRDLTVLGINVKQADKTLNLHDYVAEKYGKEEEK